MSFTIRFLAPAFLCLPPLFCPAANVITSDVCVYGGTSGGVTASVAAARLGKNVVLVMADRHLGGLSAGGLGVTDRGNVASIGGLAAEFYRRVGAAYGSSSPVYFFEPHVAELTFQQMLSGAGVSFYTNQLLASATLSNRVITAITMSDGTMYQAKEFIDTTYEGDLMALAGVTFTWGREGTNVYGESLAGVHVNGVTYRCDPYVIPGNSASGLLPLIQSDSPGATGQGDDRMQTYNYRLCLTQTATNRIPVTAPTNYSEATYELLHRYIDAYVATNGSVPLNRLIDVQTIIPNGKTDINAYADVSTDFIGYNYTYPTNTYAGRQRIAQQHRDHIAGLLYYLATSTNVPLNVRTNMQSWGYAKDEFQDNGGWPYALYVREARRMVSDYVLLQQDAQSLRAAPDPISLASYTLDCHPAARLAVNGLAVWEGSIGTSVPRPYPVSYRSIVPRVGQCRNLFCTFALSASHVGFASVRMEPVFMMTSQSAGTAAAFAIDDQASVQQVDYPKLAAQLIADGQILTWGSTQAVSSDGIIQLVVNTAGVTAAGSWSVGANTGGWPLPSGTYWHDGNTNKGAKSVRFNPTLSTNGYYDVYLWWVQDPNRATNTPVDIVNATRTNRVYVNQRTNGSAWFKVASSNYFNIGTNGSLTLRNDNTSGYVIANAVRWMPLGDIAPTQTPAPLVQIVASDALAGEFGSNTARFTLVCPNGTNTAPLVVNYSVGGTATPGVDYVALPDTVTIPAGACATNILVTPLGSSLPADQATVTLNLLASTNYTLTNLAAATVTLLDRPLNAWLRSQFLPAELSDPAISGDAADPDDDGLPNLIEFALGLPPKIPNANPLAASVSNGVLTVSYSLSKAAADVLLTPEWSADLARWYSGTNYFLPVSVVEQGTNQVVTLRATTPAAAAYCRFRAARR